MKTNPAWKPLKPLKMVPMRGGRLAGLGKIVEEHVEHEVSEATWRAMGKVGKDSVTLGHCTPDGERLQQYMSFGAGSNGKHLRGAKAQAEVKAIAALMLKEMNELRKKGVTGRIPVCLQPSKLTHPLIKPHPEETRIHERFHAQNIRRRERDGAGKGTSAFDHRTKCESENAGRAAARLLGVDQDAVRYSIPGYWTSMINWWAAPEELFARAESLRYICHVQKDKTACADTTAMFHNDIKVNAASAKDPNITRHLADAMFKAKTDAKTVFDGLGNTCNRFGPSSKASGSHLPPLKPLKPVKAAPKPKKARKTMAKKTVKKTASQRRAATEKKNAPKKTVRATGKVSGKRVKLVCTCKSV
jgi:hypothetical protein